jgi:hypothetical protein
MKLTLHSSIVTTHDDEYCSKAQTSFGWFLDDGQSEPAAPTTGIAPPIWMDDDWIEIIFSIGFQPQLTTSTEVSLVVLSLSLSLSPLHKAEATKKG